MHLPQFCCLDGVAGVEGVRDPMIAIVVNTTCYLHFVSYVLTLTAFSVISLCRRRLGSNILSWVGGDVWLGTNSISYIVDNVASSVSSNVGWRIGRSVGCIIGSRVDRLCYFIFTPSLFS
jgi:hypothetical protein